MWNLIIIGAGARSAEKELKAFLSLHNIPFVVTWGAKDMFTNDYHNLIGCFGITGSKEGNMAVQNTEHLLVLGSSLNTHHTGSNPANFARMAVKTIVDIDQEELNKSNGMIIDYKICKDIKEYLKDYGKPLYLHG
jgi:acetolactate synthase-1/2/3 large subunit